MSYNVNPNHLIQRIRNGQNPQQLMLSILEKRTKGNPLFENLFLLAQDNNTQEIENIVRRMFSERGMDFDKEFNSFKNNLGL